MTTVESIKNVCRPAPSTHSVDWREWLLRTTLSTIVWEGVRVIAPQTLRRVAPPEAGVAYEPVNLLAVITYCYAVGILSSQEIERVLASDREFVALCGNEFPRWQTIRRFRKCNRDAIQKCLAETFRVARSLHFAWQGRNEVAEKALNKTDPATIRDPIAVGSEQDSWHAEERIEQAVWMDQMAMDDENFA